MFLLPPIKHNSNRFRQERITPLKIKLFLSIACVDWRDAHKNIPRREDKVSSNDYRSFIQTSQMNDDVTNTDALKELTNSQIL